MQILDNERLEEYTTFKMGGRCKKIYFPETREDLSIISDACPEAFQHVLGCGSNLLISPKADLKEVICTKNLTEGFENFGGGKFYLPAGLLLSKAISAINASGYGGIEYLISVPGTVGGAIAMNAGRGRSYNLAISDYLQCVDVFIDGKIVRIEKDQCGFGYRKSIFGSMDAAFIIGAEFVFPECDIGESEKRKSERIMLCRNSQDTSAPNMGSVFSKFCPEIVSLVQKSTGKKYKVRFSEKTGNWLLNEGGTYEEALFLINTVKIIHELLNEDCELEIKIWK